MYNIRKIILFILLVFFVSCSNKNKDQENNATNDLTQIKKKGKIVAITSFNSTNYFIYRGQPMGFQYELLEELSSYLGLELEVIVDNDLKKKFEYLVNGKCDLIAENLTVTKNRKQSVSFTDPFAQTRQVLVQRKPENWKELTKQEIDLGVIRNQLNLAKKTIYVQKNSSHVDRLHNLSEEIGDSIFYIEVPEESEQLVAMVANGEIDYTICDEVVAKVNQTYYPNLDIQTTISFPQYLAWAIRKDSPELAMEINRWLKTFKNTTSYALLYAKYFKNKKSQIINSEYFTITSDKLSEYDDIIKKYSKKIDWDWRLVASLIYQESKFDPKAKSWAGAFGLMQLMPTTAREFSIDINSKPEENIRAGIEFLGYLDNILKEDIPKKEERIKFILAAYNAGIGHIIDAQKLAKKYGKDPNVWTENVDYFVLNKSKPKYYNDPLSKFGYCRGVETYNYVLDILSRYEHYSNILKE